MNLLDVLTAPLDGTVLVEANAGTGKTWAITGLYLRLLAEREEFTVERILAVTFTDPATVDLRRRTRKRLDEARIALRAGVSDDPFLGPWIAALPVPRETALARVENALRCFDQAAIHTIHAFCRRLLADLAFQCGVAFETATASDETDLMQAVVDDFWREKSVGLDTCLVEWLARKRITPDSLREVVAPFVHKEYLGPGQIDIIPGKPDLPSLASAFAKAHEDARAAWAAIVDPPETLTRMLRSGALSGNRYKEGTVRRGVDLAGALVGDSLTAPAVFSRLLDDDDLKDLGRLDQRTIDDSTNKDKTAPVHPFFSAVGGLLDAHGALVEGSAAATTHLRHELIFRLRRELPRRKEARRLISFDDLLLDVWHALAGERSTVLLDEARKRFGVALVDEFQDTDPVQWEIFRRIFTEGNLPLFLVGDPKQAIYSFRGADVFSYVGARDTAERRFRLTDNYRSAPGLVTAVNTLFGNANPFMLESGRQELIPYRPSGSAGNPGIALDTPEQENPLRIWQLGETASTADMEVKAVEATAGEIVRLLREARAGRIRVIEQTGEESKERALKARDMAVLVRANRHGTIVRRALEKLGVSAAQHSQDNVFDTDDATELHLVLSAIVDPADTGLMATALATGLLNGDGRQLSELRRGEAWAREAERFREYHRELSSRGFLPMFRRLLQERDVATRLLGFSGGERRLTNLLHLGELLHRAAHDEALGPEALLLWFARRLGEEDARGDSSLLRLESDDDLVHIVTVHGAKGLQYPVVFVPFAWQARKGRTVKEDLLIHDQVTPYDARLAMGVPDDSADPNRGRAGEESLAEEVRLLYVALTRARCRCYVAWGRVAGKDRNKNDNSPLARLLWREETQDRTEDRQRLDAWANGSGRSIVLLEPPGKETRLRAEDCPTDGWAALPFSRGRLRASWRHASYSGLTAVAHASRDDDAPDHDEAAPVPTEPMPWETLPAGAEIGTCLHTIFERWDPGKEETLRPITERALGGAGIDPKHAQAAVDLIVRAVRTPLFDGGPTLEKVPKAHRMEEMEFWFPLASLDPARLKRALDTGHLAPDFREQVGRLDFNAVHGFMKGFVDLVFEHAGKWYVCDYKSNRLADYTPERIDETMARSLYFVQYLLYTVALHRYLRLRLPRYGYDTHIGGVAYLFLRGMRPDRPGSGVFRDRPARELVEALDACMGKTT